MQELKEKYNYFTNPTKAIIELPFHELTGQDLSYLNEFHLNRKRTYCNLSNLICEYSNNILGESERPGDLLSDYFMLKYKISKQEDYDIEEFKKDLYALVTPNLIKAIHLNVEKNYCINLDASVKSNKQKNDSLMFTDGHCKLLLKISLTQKYLIPLAMEYLHHNYSEMINKVYKVDNYLLDIFEDLLEADYFNPGFKINISHKLYEYVKSRVQATNYSDKVLWGYYEYIGETSHTCMEQFTKKLITDVIPKFTIDGNIVNLIHAIIKRSLENFFRNNYQVNFKTLDLSKDSEDLSSFDKMEINNARVDESEIVINNNNLKLTIMRLIKEHKIVITMDEYLFYSRHTEVNQLQMNLLFLFFAKEMKGQKPLYNSNKKDYVLLLIILRRMLERCNFKVLQYVITGNIINKINEKKTINKKQLYKIIESEKYQHLLNNKFAFVANLMNDSKLLERLIATILNNKFSLVDYDSQDELDEELKVNVDVLSEEILQFLEMV